MNKAKIAFNQVIKTSYEKLSRDKKFFTNLKTAVITLLISKELFIQGHKWFQQMKKLFPE
ncbi:hypothetical protein CN507_14650 [Bacillus cereus]|nr:hypothetical protein CN507_14650 [Bacillus cereus]